MQDPWQSDSAKELYVKIRYRSRLYENSDVELICLDYVDWEKSSTGSAKGGQGRKQFCAFSARARFHTA